MARIIRQGDFLILRLNPLERLLDLRLRSPKVSVRYVESIEAVRPGPVLLEVDHGLAGNSAPLGAVITAKARGSSYQGGRAAAFVYLRLRSVKVAFSDSCPWRLWLVSSTQARAEAERLRTALGT